MKGASGSYAGRVGAGGGIYINNSGQVAARTADYKRATFDLNHLITDGLALRLNLMVHDAGVAGRDEVNQSR